MGSVSLLCVAHDGRSGQVQSVHRVGLLVVCLVAVLLRFMGCVQTQQHAP